MKYELYKKGLLVRSIEARDYDEAIDKSYPYVDACNMDDYEVRGPVDEEKA